MLRGYGDAYRTALTAVLREVFMFQCRQLQWHSVGLRQSFKLAGLTCANPNFALRLFRHRPLPRHDWHGRNAVFWRTIN